MNGCGPKWLKIAPIEYEACNSHDRAYTSGGDRRAIDKKFLDQMLEEKPDKWYVAYAYYFLVRIFGWLYFKQKQNGSILDYGTR